MKAAILANMDDSSSGTATPVDVEKAGHGEDIRKRLTVTFRALSVRVTAPDAALGSTLWSVMDPRQLGNVFRRKEDQKRTILNNISGQVKPGEMLLVLGRPGSGCTSLLSVLSNDREQFSEVDGDLRFGSMDHTAAQDFRQQIMFNNEDDLHFPTLSVNRTLKFALRNKVPHERPTELASHQDYIMGKRDTILDSLGIAHTKKTRVGNEYIRGVSGGERKRVSLAEVMAGQSPVQLWDNPTRGLDSKAALEFARLLRREADENHKTIITTTYQAGNGIYDAFDKVLVLAEGRVIYYGPRYLAKEYFESLGFTCPRGANIADYLTSVTVLTERIVRPGWEERVPNTPEEFEATYHGSDICQEQMVSIVPPEQLSHETEDLRIAVASEKRKKLLPLKQSVYTAGLWDQVRSCTLRQFQIMWGDKLSLFIKVFSAIIQALVCGSLFYNLPDDSGSIFTRPGVVFFPVIYFLLESMSETTASFMGRPILSRQKRFGFYRPTAFCIANAITDIPVIMIQVSCFSLVLYFMSALQMDAGRFFTFWVIVIVQTLCFVQLFRSVGALCSKFGTASELCGLLSTVFFVYGGYLVPFYKMRVWFRWIFYLNPGAYAFEALMANEFVGRQLVCKEPYYIPYGASYPDTASPHRACSVVGSNAEGIIDGAAYIHEQYNYSPHHIWRSFGVIIGFWLFFIGLTSLGFELKNSRSGSSILLYKRGSKNDQKKPTPRSDAVAEASHSSAPARSPKQSTFTWQNLDYHVPFQGEKRQLLNKVFGYVKPGNLVALMGASGAGKTTLLDVLAQRKDSGEVYGSILIDGRPQGISFQRTTGYCEQMDVHEPTATVKEALVFSALLRQQASIPREEKLAYVDHIINLLELGDIEDALIGVPGAGLSIEQRKRVTLGVELVAKPTLLFLDEPTSGLDGQSAFNIVRFLRKLVDGGQAVLCTIHQPSAVLFDAFDGLLLLAKGGRMTYFGETGHESGKILDYFSRNGAPCPPGANPAEHIIDVVQGGGESQKTDWVEVWNQSSERQTALSELEALNKAGMEDTAHEENTATFATSHWFQFKMVTTRLSLKIWRSPDYMWNKFILHIFAALFSGFTFWKLGNGTFSLQLRLFAVFNFIFVAPGCINQMQPFFLANRDIFETREKKSKTYHWIAFIGAQTVAEIPYLIVCATLYFVCFYFTAGLPVKASISGHFYLQMIFYEFLYTSIGQAIAAYAPNEYFAAVMNPVLLGAGLVSFCGVVVPYSQMQPFWRYWMYYLDPFTYLVGGLLGEILWDVKVECEPSEYVTFSAPSGQTCGEYMSDFLSSRPGYLLDPNSTSCSFCQYSSGAEYAKTFNLQAKYYSWRDTAITALFCISSYALVFLMMKLRSKKTKSARSE
ncbi:ABC-2 type transporter / CDR ABC transporter family protein [Penicillium ucsense]|uniref:ABC-2 type transporter / CDR ABC transporter family protein n=1 Tax=Penicillium ucsense TaxID=2839758 RepID=A0A8J8WBA7_9EURO|nr:ABC-2 type transporter / CDR ABC transporter family protein [Penicillium ucsense]KAF7735091.1 ABC-2 type transporter / CDR ABC transporter family protein [Penicillium ucsense]